MCDGPDQQAALAAYWSAETPQAERDAYARMRELGMPASYGEDAVVSEMSIPEPLATSLRMYPEPDKRVGMRSAFSDAAAECDRIAEEIIAAGRKSKLREAEAAVAKRCADAIDRLRSMVEVPAAPAGRPGAFGEVG